jgi:PKD repeat protein
MIRKRLLFVLSLFVVMLMGMMLLPAGGGQNAGVSALTAGSELLPERLNPFMDDIGDFTNPPGTNWGTLFGTEYTIGRDIIGIDGGYLSAGYGWIPDTDHFDEWGVLAKYDLDGNEVDSASYIDGVFNKAYAVLYDAENDRYMLTGAKYDNYDDGPEHWANDMVWLASVNSATLDIDWDRTYPNAFANWGNSIVTDGDGYIIGGFDTISAAAHQGWSWVGRADSSGTLNWELGENSDGDSLWLGTAEVYSVEKTTDGGLVLSTEDGIVKFHLDNPPAAASFMWKAAPGAKYYAARQTLAGGYIGVGEIEVDEAWEGGDSHTDLIITKLDGFGNVIWSRTYGRSAPVAYDKYATGMNDAGYDIVETGGGHFVVTGYTESYGYHGGKDLLVIEYDSNGDVVWDQALGGEGDDEGRSIVTASNGYVIAGTATWNERPRIWTVSTPGAFTEPVAAFTYAPASPLFIEDTVSFNAVASYDPDGNIARYIWDFGDGTFEESTVNTITHRYHSPGTFNATLFVIDNDGIMAEYTLPVETKVMEMQWQEFYGNGNDWGQALAPAPDGGFIVAGINVVGAGYGNVWAFKTDGRGNPVWERIFADPHGYIDGGRAVIAAHDGGYIVGAFRETSGSPVRNRDIWLLKLDETDGHKVWETFHDFGTGIDEVYDIQYDGDGYILTGCATAANPARFRDIILLKVDAEGNEVWHEFYPDTVTNKQTCGYSVDLTGDGGYIITGGYANNKNTTGPFLTIKIGADRSEQWRTNTAGATTKSTGYYVEQTGDGGYIAAGTLGGDYALLKYSSSGHVDWKKTWDMGYNADYGLAADSFTDGGYIIVGDIIQYVDSEIWDDMYIVRTDASGNMCWDWLTDTASPTEGASDVMAFANGSYVVLGTRYVSAASAGGTWLYKVGPNSKPTAAFTYLPPEPTVGHAVHFNASASLDDEGLVTDFTWDFGDGSSGEGVTTDHIYAAAGTYPVTLTVADADGGEDSITQDITIADGMGADFSGAPRKGRAPLEVIFDSTVYGGTPPFTYSWDFESDGIIDDATADPVWTYEEPGVYSVSFEVRDSSSRVNVIEKLNYIVVTGIKSTNPDVTITAADFSDDPASDPDTYDPIAAPGDIDWATARGFELAAAGPDGTYDFDITFTSPLDPGFTLYKLPGWVEIPYTVIDAYTIRISLTITGGVLDPPFVMAGTFGQTWRLDSGTAAAGFYEMEQVGGPGDDGQAGSVPAAGPDLLWLSDQTAQTPVVFPAGDWQIRIKTSGWIGACAAQVGEYDGGQFNAFNVTPLDGAQSGDIITFTIPGTGGTVPAGHYLALKLMVTGDGEIVTDGDSYVRSPSSDPGYPLNELAAGILALLGLAGLGGFILIRKSRAASLQKRAN